MNEPLVPKKKFYLFEKETEENNHVTFHCIHSNKTVTVLLHY